jgi:hypothetical protein
LTSVRAGRAAGAGPRTGGWEVGQRKNAPNSATRMITAPRTRAEVFVSYSRKKDVRQVRLYAEALDDCGIELLFDLTSIEPGEELEEKLSELIDKADVFYLMWSRNAAMSQRVEKETLTAVARYDNDSKHLPRIRPVVIEQPMPEPPSHLRRFQFNSMGRASNCANAFGVLPADPPGPTESCRF